jgi:folate-dependent phosphoribosylglycinamide formyltransferase PurN
MLRIAVLCSKKAPGLIEALAEPGPRGALYDVVACLTSEPDCCEARTLDALAVPLITHDIHAFHRARRSKLGDGAARRAYDAETLRLLAPYQPDLIVCCGYLYVLTRTFLDAYPAAIVNLHHSDLYVTRADGSPKYPGLHAVRDAILAGESETRSTVHLVTDEIDAGPPLMRSWAFPVAGELVSAARSWGAIDILKAYAYAHEQWMLRAAWPELLRSTFERFARTGSGVTRNSSCGNDDSTPAVPWERGEWQPDERPDVLELNPDGTVFSLEPTAQDELALAGV